MDKECLKSPLGLSQIFKLLKYKLELLRMSESHLRTFGTAVFCGPQGSGKTLSAVEYVRNLLDKYPHAVLVTNVAIKGHKFNAYLDDNDTLRYIDNNHQCHNDYIKLQYCLSTFSNEVYRRPVVEYQGIDHLLKIRNGKQGVIFLLDELHLEFNSLESKNISIEEMIEISQQRKQRIHIVGTSQVFMRLAKPLREQIHDVVVCRCIAELFQLNKVVDGETLSEENGKTTGTVKATQFFFHRPDMYEAYDTYAKMKRYKNEWQGHTRQQLYNFNEKE